MRLCAPWKEEKNVRGSCWSLFSSSDTLLISIRILGGMSMTSCGMSLSFSDAMSSPWSAFALATFFSTASRIPCSHHPSQHTL
eukprot:CAMPEP_0172087936 /NCGR_PEP_ID=MMETSP1043-20130122/22960_1 /TAXON_ID=464988 /ORGANISM="Hemiselmis andersenii, Strain CCMP441" /LENGTH=82 /DNA_ID=CAMNT_0012750195 /DNA_START=135 /DNA_END=380 /DNA_ORIENTATION=+